MSVQAASSAATPFQGAGSAVAQPEFTLALVLPFIDDQVRSRLTPVLTRWASPEYAPCAPGSAAQSAVALFYHPLGGSSSEAVIMHLWSALPPETKACFAGGIRFMYGNIERSVAMAHPDGTCAQFYVLFQVLKGVASAFFLMEPDVTPIRPQWLAELVRLASPKQLVSFWMRGSVSRCDADYGDLRVRRDMHINGNALYRVGDLAFEDYLTRVRQFYPSHTAYRVAFPGCATGAGGEDGFDHAMFQASALPECPLFACAPHARLPERPPSATDDGRLRCRGAVPTSPS